MKKLLLFSLILTGTSFAQTNIIAAKSHASSHVIDKNDTDNFGEPGPMRFVKHVKYLTSDCIVEKYEVQWSDHDTEYDTVCDHPFLKEGTVDIERIKEMYPEGTTFEGFDNLNLDGKKPRKILKKEKKEKRDQKKSSTLILMLIGGGLFLIYLFVPKMKPSRS